MRLLRDASITVNENKRLVVIENAKANVGVAGWGSSASFGILKAFCGSLRKH